MNLKSVGSQVVVFAVPDVFHLHWYFHFCGIASTIALILYAFPFLLLLLLPVCSLLPITISESLGEGRIAPCSSQLAKVREGYRG